MGGKPSSEASAEAEAQPVDDDGDEKGDLESGTTQADRKGAAAEAEARAKKIASMTPNKLVQFNYAYQQQSESVSAHFCVC